MTGKPPPVPDTPVRDVLRLLYFPYTLLVFVPLLGVTTLFWGIVAGLLSYISRRAAFHVGTIWAFCLCWANFTLVTAKGRDKARKDKSYVIMCNHQSHFDVLAFYGYCGRQFRWVMKKELRRVPGLGWGCERIGHIFVDRSDSKKAIASLEAARPLLESGISVLIFPEGTRSRDGRMGDFKKGGFMTALQLGLPILPMTVTGSRHVLPGKTWKLLPGRIRIQIHDPVDVTQYGLERREELMADVRRIIAAPLTEWERGE